jgi:hypothetical protein
VTNTRLSRFYGLVTSVLQKLINLADLTILVQDDGLFTWPTCGRLFANCTFQLRNLACHFPLDRDFIEFLNDQPEILRLEWNPWSYSSETFRQGMLPKLSVLVVSDDNFVTPHLLHQLITYFPITYLDMRDAPLDESVNSLPLGQPSLRGLSLWVFYSDESLKVARVFPNLEYLTVNCAGGVDVRC